MCPGCLQRRSLRVIEWTAEDIKEADEDKEDEEGLPIVFRVRCCHHLYHKQTPTFPYNEESALCRFD